MTRNVSTAADDVNPDHVLHTMTSDAGRKTAEKLFKMHVQDDALYHPRLPAFLLAVDRLLAQHGGRPPVDPDKHDADDEDGDDYEDDEDLHEENAADAEAASIKRAVRLALGRAESATYRADNTMPMGNEERQLRASIGDALGRLVIGNDPAHARFLRSMADMAEAQRDAVDPHPFHLRSINTQVQQAMRDDIPGAGKNLRPSDKVRELSQELLTMARTALRDVARSGDLPDLKRASDYLRISNCLCSGNMVDAHEHAMTLPEGQVSGALLRKLARHAD